MFPLPCLLLALAVGAQASELSAKFLSHPPLIALPAVSARALPAGPVHFVDARKGDDAAGGSEQQPWKTVTDALGRVKPGETLCLRGGVYHEEVKVSLEGSAEKPIVIRSYPGELAIIDGGLAEFLDKPADAWAPVAGGAPGEFQSKQRHPNLRDVMGAFGDSLIGLHTYHNAIDLRADNEFWDPENPADPKNSDVKPVYCGPGLWYDRVDGRVHIRLAPTHVPGIENYAGESDPRKLPLVIAPYRTVPLHVDGASHVVFQDLVIRGGGYHTVVLEQTHDLAFENVTIFASTYGIRATGTQRLKLDHCALIGTVPPWSFRTDTSLRSYGGEVRRDITRFGTHALLVQEAGREYSVFAYPINDDWEIAHCDFTGSHDGIYLGGVSVRFHHNRLWGTQDDGIYLSPMYPRMGKAKPCDIHLYQNLIGNVLTALAFGGPELKNNDHVFLYRNVFDLRTPIKAGRPSSKEATPRFSSGGMVGDHGSPPWSTMTIYQNTFLAAEHCRSADMSLLGATSPERPRRFYNNLLLHLEGRGLPPKLKLPPLNDAKEEGNVYWSPITTLPKEAFNTILQAKANAMLPAFLRIATDPSAAQDYRLKADNLAQSAGVQLPPEWPDPLRQQDQEKPDAGALPLGAEPLQVGR